MKILLPAKKSILLFEQNAPINNDAVKDKKIEDIKNNKRKKKKEEMKFGSQSERVFFNFPLFIAITMITTNKVNSGACTESQ